ncbi:uncharacterized protein [Kogia breviceps]|uniref:uncharacterized protein n=1 Tax=Kogia breviceps TaxID=27615 RepID=UPI0034D2705B
MPETFTFLWDFTQKRARRSSCAATCTRPGPHHRDSQPDRHPEGDALHGHGPDARPRRGAGGVQAVAVPQDLEPREVGPPKPRPRLPMISSATLEKAPKHTLNDTLRGVCEDPGGARRGILPNFSVYQKGQDLKRLRSAFCSSRWLSGRFCEDHRLSCLHALQGALLETIHVCADDHQGCPGSRSLSWASDPGLHQPAGRPLK